MLKPYACLALFCSLLLPSFAHADDSDVGCVTTEWKLLGANHKVCVSAFNDPDIPGVACYISQAKTGGVSVARACRRSVQLRHFVQPGQPYRNSRQAPQAGQRIP